jgi:hypothetical protein
VPNSIKEGTPEANKGSTQKESALSMNAMEKFIVSSGQCLGQKACMRPEKRRAVSSQFQEGFNNDFQDATPLDED